jgi:hypothetical protein
LEKITVHSFAFGIVKSAYSPAGNSLSPTFTVSLNLIFVGAFAPGAPELPVRHEAAENLAVVLVRPRVIDLHIGQSDALLHHAARAGVRKFHRLLRKSGGGEGSEAESSRQCKRTKREFES